MSFPFLKTSSGLFDDEFELELGSEACCFPLSCISVSAILALSLGLLKTGVFPLSIFSSGISNLVGDVGLSIACVFLVLAPDSTTGLCIALLFSAESENMS